MAIRQRIGLRQVRALRPGQTVWDASLSGFGARRQKSDAVSYVYIIALEKGGNAGTRLAGMVRPGHLRARAKRRSASSGDVAHSPIRLGEKRTARSAQTVSKLCDLYLADAVDGRLW